MCLPLAIAVGERAFVMLSGGDRGSPMPEYREGTVAPTGEGVVTFGWLSCSN